MKARAYLPKKKLGGIVLFLEDVFKYDFLPGWKQLMEKPKDFFDMKFESDWDEKSNMKWRGWGY
jgi:hypothetical protein